LYQALLDCERGFLLQAVCAVVQHTGEVAMSSDSQGVWPVVVALASGK
jgi:hypothetical protein